MTLRTSTLASLGLLAAGCSEPMSEQPAASRADSATERVEISTSADCLARYGRPTPGLQITYDGRSARADADFGFRYAIETVEGDRARATETLLVGSARDDGPKMPIVRRQGLIVAESGGGGSRRTYEYGSLPAEAIQMLRPGESFETTVTERSDFSPGGPGVAHGRLKVTFVGCSTLVVEGRDEVAKVFDVESAARAIKPLKDSGVPRDETVTTRNRYWMSERLGWPLIDETADGSIVAVRISEN
jgi:hypothetical protein